MPKTHVITHHKNLTKISFLVKPSFGQLKVIIDDLAANHYHKKRLWDLSQIDFTLSSEEIRKIAEYGKTKLTHTNKVAFYVASDLAFGELRQFEAYRAEDEKTATKVFRDELSAIE